MAINFLLKRSNTASKRPTAAQLDIGELSLNYDADTAGVFFEDSAGNVRKVGPAEVSATAPNASPAGSSGNSLGELWYDTGTSNLQIWTGAAFVAATSTVGAAGSDTEVQFNDNGVLAGSSDFVWDNTDKVLGVSGDIDLDIGGTYTTSLQTITPTADRVISLPNATGTVGLVAGASGQVTYNSGGAFAGDSGLLYDGTTGKLTVGGKTVTTNNPVLSLTQTWNASGIAFSGIDLNITNTASADGAALLNLRVGGTSQFAIGTAGQIVPVSNAQEQRNAANPQTYRLYNTFTSSTSFERANLTWSSNVFIIAPERGSAGGSVREFSLRGGLAIGTNVDGGQLTLRGGQSTGTGNGGSIVFETTSAGSTGSTANTSTERFRIGPNGVLSKNQGAPIAVDTDTTVTVANLQIGILTSDTASTAVTITLPTGTNMDGGFASPYINQMFEWSVINLDDTLAVTIAGNTDHTLVGNDEVSAETSARWASRRTAANTWVSYRLS